MSVGHTSQLQGLLETSKQLTDRAVNYRELHPMAAIPKGLPDGDDGIACTPTPEIYRFSSRFNSKTPANYAVNDVPQKVALALILAYG
jgi:hypothetical protein